MLPHTWLLCDGQADYIQYDPQQQLGQNGEVWSGKAERRYIRDNGSMVERCGKVFRIAQQEVEQTPIGSMYAIYGNIYHQYTPVMLAYIPAPWIRHGT